MNFFAISNLDLRVPKRSKAPVSPSAPGVRGNSYDAAVQGRVDELWVDAGEAGELALVDVGDDQLVGRGQHRLRAREELVEVFCPFAALDRKRQEHKHQIRAVPPLAQMHLYSTGPISEWSLSEWT